MRNNESSAGERGRRGGGGGGGDFRHITKRDRGCPQLEKLLEEGDMWRATLGSQNFSHSGAASENNRARASPPTLHLEDARGELGEISFLHFPLPLFHVRFETYGVCVSRRSTFVKDGASSLRERQEETFLSLGSVFSRSLKWLPF